MKKFFAILDSSRTTIPAAKRYVGVEGGEELYAEHFNTLAYELNQVDFIIGTAADVTNGAANVKIITGGIFHDIAGSVVTFVQGDRIAIIGHDALDANLAFTLNDLVFSMNPDVSIDLGSTYTFTVSGSNARGNLNFTNAIDKSVIYGDSTSYLDISTDNDSSVKAAGSGLINGDHFDGNENLTDNLFLNSFKDYWQGGVVISTILNGQNFATDYLYTKAGTNVAEITHDVTKQADAPTIAESGVKSLYCPRLTYAGAGIPTLAADDVCTIDLPVNGYSFRQIDQDTATYAVWLKFSIAGTYCISFRNSGSDRSYVAEVVVDSAGVWERKEISLDFDYSGGTWDYAEGTGVTASICLGAGTNFQTTADVWQTGNFVATASQTNALVVGAGTYQFTLDTLNRGSIAQEPKQILNRKIEYIGDGTDFTITGPAGWVTKEAVAIYYKTSDGAHRLKGTVSGAYTTTTSSVSVTLSGVTFKTGDIYGQYVGATFYQGGVTAVNSTRMDGAYTSQGTGNIVVQNNTVSNTTVVNIGFDVALDSKPTMVV